MQKALTISAGVAPTTQRCGAKISSQKVKAFSATPMPVRSRSLRTAPAKRQQVAIQASGTDSKTEETFIPVCKPEDLPKGVRKEVRVRGKSVLLFWYRNQIYAIEARSPAEGAYSEGFIRSKFTQDYCIECPSTGSTFSLKDGSIMSWYPGNPVLRLLTPQDTCRNLEIYPVKLSQDAIAIDVSGSAVLFGSNATKGGSDTSLENNNVYGLEPKVYIEEGTAEGGETGVAQAATAAVAFLAVAGIAGTLLALVIFVSQ